MTTPKPDFIRDGNKILNTELMHVSVYRSINAAKRASRSQQSLDKSVRLGHIKINEEIHTVSNIL